MSKRTKKRWFNRGSWAGNEKADTLFPNSVAKHERKFDEDGFEILPEDDYGSSYMWDLDKEELSDKYHSTGDREVDIKNKYSLAQSEYKKNYDAYERTGVWNYYAPKQNLSYKYVQQMANLLSAQYNIQVEVGDDWKVDLIHKKLTYNPASLIYGTKSELIATLMHEIGKIRYVTHPSLLKNKYLTMYDKPAVEVLSIFEDLRTDYLMLKSYEGAAEIYESIIPTIENQIKNFLIVATRIRKSYIDMLKYLYKIACNSTDEKTVERNLLNMFGYSSKEKVQQGIEEIENMDTGNIYNYCAEIVALMYQIEIRKKPAENIQKAIEQTEHSIDISKDQKNSTELVNYLDVEVYPKIEDLLKDMNDKEKALEKAFPKQTPQARAEMMKQLNGAQMGAGHNGSNTDSNKNIVPRQSGKSMGRGNVPPEWQKGDYQILKDSVEMEIKQLVNRLTFLRRQEQTIKYESNQKRGKLNAKKLYKSSYGGRRLFKKKMDSIDTIQSFTFSLLLDISGSMAGSRIIHSTRSMIMLAEVFKKMKIPFEINFFGDSAENVKSFESDMNKSIEGDLGGIVNHCNSGTQLERGLNAIKIKNQPEKNKIVVILTDGEVGNPDNFNKEYFESWLKKGIKSVCFGINCGEGIEKLCLGNGKNVKNVSELPNEFSNLLKQLIK